MLGRQHRRIAQGVVASDRQQVVDAKPLQVLDHHRRHVENSRFDFFAGTQILLDVLGQLVRFHARGLGAGGVQECSTGAVD